MQNTEGKIRNKPGRIIALVAVSVILLCTIFLYIGEAANTFGWTKLYSNFVLTENLSTEFSVTFLSVGKADCSVIHCGDQTLVVDTGLSQTNSTLTSFLKRHNIQKIDALILSHADKDHIGGANDVIDEFEVQSVYMPKIPDDQVPNSLEYKSLINSIKENNLKIVNPEFADNLTFGNMAVDFIMPNKNYDNINDNSLVFRLCYKDISVLFSGDISEKAEEDILNSNAELKSTILKVAHHGSATSSGEDFLQAVSPQIAVVCSGKSSSNLPDYTTMARLSKFCESLYCTADDKTVVISYDNDNLSVQTGL